MREKAYTAYDLTDFADPFGFEEVAGACEELLAFGGLIFYVCVCVCGVGVRECV